MKRFTLTSVIAITAGAAFAGSASAQTELVFGHGAHPENPRYDAAEMVKEMVEERTDGEVTIRLAPEAQEGDDDEMLSALQLGTMDLSANSQGPLATVVPEFNALGLPFLFETAEHAWDVVDGEIGEELADAVAAEGMVLLGFWDNGIRHISNSQRPIEEPSDLEGLRIRTPNDPTTIDTFEALGADPEPLAFEELYIALEQGAFDGQENPLVNIHSARLYEVQDYISFTGHKWESTPILASEAIWEGLSEEHREIIRDAVTEAGEWQRQAVVDGDEEVREIMAEHVDYNDANVEAFQEATAGVHDAWEDELGEIVLRVREAAEAER